MAAVEDTMARVPFFGLCIGAVFCALIVATICTIGAVSQNRRFGFTNWDEFESFDEPYGPPLKDVLSKKEGDGGNQASP
jgi:hypothetical protein